MSLAIRRTGIYERFDVLAELGRGGMGVVVRAFDRMNQAQMALKSAGSVTGAALLRFKREFRAVQHLSHPNVVSLGELLEDSESGVQQTDIGMMGTPAYMAPEQAAGRPVTKASDWYSVGAMLYEALCGRVPFEGNTLKVLVDKQTLTPLRPSERTEEPVPSDLEDLCTRMLAMAPEERPAGEEILRELGARPTSRSRSPGSTQGEASLGPLGESHSPKASGCFRATAGRTAKG